jgi:thymidylate synthase
MIVIGARNVNDAFWAGARLLREHGIQQNSRNGSVLRAPFPVTTVYEQPTERVLLDRRRDANPFFHLYESLWMLAGRNDLAPLTAFVKNMVNFSDDGGNTQPGAYGYRWRRHFNRDQLAWAIKRLKADPNDRRVVIQMYDAGKDQDAADYGGRDIPCNLMALPAVSPEGKLDLTVFNRSNDMIWGAYGANAVHFSVLQEFLAAAIGIPVGRYYQVSNNFHGYLTTMEKAALSWEEGETMLDPYTAGAVFPVPMWNNSFNLKEWEEDLIIFLEEPSRVGIRSRFLRRVACPMVMAHRAWRKEGTAAAREIIQQMPEGCDWRAGAEVWLDNRDDRKRKGET